MIDRALEFLTQEINTYLLQKSGPSGSSLANEIVLTNVADESGKWAIPDRTLGLSLINIEEERTFKDQQSVYRNLNGDIEHYNPEIKLNLYVLVSANFCVGESGGTDNTSNFSGLYAEGLKQLSYVISFFQGKNVFTVDNSPGLDPEIKKLVVELHSYSFEQQYNFWNVVGAKYLPSALYRVRVLTYQEKRLLDQQDPIVNISVSSNGISTF